MLISYLGVGACPEYYGITAFSCIQSQTEGISFRYWLSTHIVHVRPDLPTDSVGLDTHLRPRASATAHRIGSEMP